MTRSPVQPRAGHTALPNELLARALADLDPPQFRLLVGLFYEAEFKRDGATTPDGRWRVAFGQVLVSYSGLAERYGLTGEGVRWAMRRFRDFGITTRPAARPNEPTHQTAGDLPNRHTNRPNVVDLGIWAEFLGDRPENPNQSNRQDPSRNTSHHPRIQDGNTGTPNTEKLPLVTEAAASGDAGQLERVVAVWDRVCVPAGFAKARSTPQQRKAARARLREPGWFDAFTAACEHVATEPFYRGASSSGWVLTLGWLLKPGNAEKTAERATTRRASAPIPQGKRPGMARMGSAAEFARNEVPWNLPSAPVAEWAAVLAEHDRLPPDEQRRGIRDLDVRMRGDALVLRARDRFDAERLREWWAPGVSKLAEKALGRRMAVLVDDPDRDVRVGSAPAEPPEAFVGGERELS